MKDFFEKLKKGLDKTRDSISSKLNSVISSFRKVDEDFFEELEEILILSDMGVSASSKIISALRNEAKQNKISEPIEIKEKLREIISRIVDIGFEEYAYPLVILVVGVNGVGKTTAIGKLAYLFKNMGKSVSIAAADTFRAAAAEQLDIWAKRAGASIIKYSKEGADPAAVVYDAIDSCRHKKTDVLICDTAGRLHNKKNLMAELQKIHKVIDKEYEQAKKEAYLVIDAATGQNALAQARVFLGMSDITGIILTKLDGTAKGGVIVAICEELKIPVRYVGVGEAIDDLEPFNPDIFSKNIIE